MLARIKLRHFRNYEDLDLDLGPGLTLVIGANGQGKSNLLEAVYYLSLLRSFRTREVRTLRRWGSDTFFVGGTVQETSDTTVVRQLAVGYGKRRHLRVDGHTVRHAREFVHELFCFPFVPEDISLVKEGGVRRRRFLDIALSQCSTAYMVHLQRYSLALRYRNSALRQAAVHGQSAVHAYDAILAEHGAFLTAARRNFVNVLNEDLSELSERLFGMGATRFSLRYQSNLLRTEEETPDREEIARMSTALLADALDRDLSDGCTRHGPHRDDLRLQLGNRDLSVYGSEGQCRMASLAMRVACFRVVREKLGAAAAVVLLVDDVFGELDPARRRAFFEVLQEGRQVFIAGTGALGDLADRADSVLRVENGRVERER